MNPNSITVETIINAPLNKVWHYWNDPAHIQSWMHASEDWECPLSINNLKEGGTFSHTLAAKDKSVSFEVYGIYTKVEPEKTIHYTMGDNRKVEIVFNSLENGVHVIETFEPENENSEDLQRNGWQTILTNFKNYVENN